ncbi:MAG: amino acid ABC transporter permease [Desulfosoma sp.]|uniref:amino acid ABC transporter permease n=1 Tax=Desulfosoma sp. TaxID=2603217 RepID=UPI00404B6D6F
MHSSPKAPRTSPSKESFWLDPRIRAVLFQALVLGAVGLLAWYLTANTVANLQRQKIATGFGFLQKEAAFEIGESVIAYNATDTYARALLVGALNTIKVAAIGIALTVVLGTFIGIARLSSNWLVARLAAVYIEVMQDIPVLLQLFFWYALFYEMLPGPRQALNPLTGVYVCNRGLIVPSLEPHPAWRCMILALVAAMAASWLLRSWARRRQDRTGRPFPVFRVSVVLILGAPFVTWWGFGFPRAITLPELQGFNFSGGKTLSPEFSALLLGLVLYTAAFVAEIVRAGIQAVGKGQREAAMALGLRPAQVLRLVILPQALRVIIPPLTSQMLNLTKNSSLAVAIGYPDFVSVANTTINQTGQSIEGVAMIMVVYLFFSLSTSAFMNWYNKKAKLVER